MAESVSLLLRRCARLSNQLHSNSLHEGLPLLRQMRREMRVPAAVRKSNADYVLFSMVPSHECKSSFHNFQPQSVHEFLIAQHGRGLLLVETSLWSIVIITTGNNFRSTFSLRHHSRRSQGDTTSSCFLTPRAWIRSSRRNKRMCRSCGRCVTCVRHGLRFTRICLQHTGKVNEYVKIRDRNQESIDSKLRASFEKA